MLLIKYIFILHIFLSFQDFGLEKIYIFVME